MKSEPVYALPPPSWIQGYKVLLAKEGLWLYSGFFRPPAPPPWPNPNANTGQNGVERSLHSFIEWGVITLSFLRFDGYAHK